MSLKKIAEIAGVSVSTVSRVLNNPDHRCSSPQVRERIWQAASISKSARDVAVVGCISTQFIADAFLRIENKCRQLDLIADGLYDRRKVGVARN